MRGPGGNMIHLEMVAPGPQPAAVAFDLPWPPSVNHYWRSPNRGPLAGRHLISKAGREYRQAVCWALSGSKPLAGSLEVEIIAMPPDRRRRDLDNLLKGTLDSLCHASVIADDSLIDRLVIERGDVVKGGRLTVTVRQR